MINKKKAYIAIKFMARTTDIGNIHYFANRNLEFNYFHKYAVYQK